MTDDSGADKHTFLFGVAVIGAIVLLGGMVYYFSLPPSLTVVEHDQAFKSVEMVGEHTIEVTLAESQSDGVRVVVLTEEDSVTDSHSLSVGERTFTVNTAKTNFGGAIRGNYTIQLVARNGTVIAKTVISI